MATGSIDLAMSRRTDFDLCVYWKRDESLSDLSEYRDKAKPTGRFWAKEENVLQGEKQDIANAFLFDRSTITLSTRDRTSVDEGDVVEYDGALWRVANVQFVRLHRQSQYLKDESRKTYIQLRR